MLINDTTDTDRSASYLDLHLESDSEGWLRAKLLRQKGWFQFPIVNFPFIHSNNQQHLHMEYISLSWYDIPELVVPIKISLIRVAANKEATEPLS
jgi:hypothetical protein